MANRIRYKNNGGVLSSTQTYDNLKVLITNHDSKFTYSLRDVTTDDVVVSGSAPTLAKAKARAKTELEARGIVFPKEVRAKKNVSEVA